MNQQPLPLLQSLPHGGLTIPPEVQDRLAIDATTIYNECDLWVNELFDFAHPDLVPLNAQSSISGTLAAVTMPVARVLVDANRPPNDADNPDGSIKSLTSYGEPIYTSPLTPLERQQLLDRYWHPFHTELDAAINSHARQTLLFLDCHNMAQYGPAAYHNPGAQRPLICIANLGNARGEPKSSGPEITCPGWLLREAGELAEILFADLPLLQPDTTSAPIVALNKPFAGGYILRKNSRLLANAGNRPVPGMMIEVNRGLFVGEQTARTAIAPPNLPRIAAIRTRLYQWVLGVLELL
jgi:N-formylglutamate deformylase